MHTTTDTATDYRGNALRLATADAARLAIQVDVLKQVMAMLGETIAADQLDAAMGFLEKAQAEMQFHIDGGR